MEVFCKIRPTLLQTADQFPPRASAKWVRRLPTGKLRQSQTGRSARLIGHLAPGPIGGPFALQLGRSFAPAASSSLGAPISIHLLRSCARTDTRPPRDRHQFAATGACVSRGRQSGLSVALSARQFPFPRAPRGARKRRKEAKIIGPNLYSHIISKWWLRKEAPKLWRPSSRQASGQQAPCRPEAAAKCTCGQPAGLARSSGRAASKQIPEIKLHAFWPAA